MNMLKKKKKNRSYRAPNCEHFHWDQNDIFSLI